MIVNLASRFRRLAVAAAVTAAAVAGTTVALPAEPAAAAITTSYFSLDSTVTCDPTRNTVRVTATAAAQPGYYGMAIQIRQWISDGRSAPQWTPWSGWTRLWGPGLVTLLDVSSGVGDGAFMDVYTELRYWTGTAWSVAQGTWATKYEVSPYTGRVYFNGFCTT